MAQVTIYMPDQLEKELRRRAKRTGRSLSSIVTELARAQLHPQEWPEEFKQLFGSWEGDFPEPDDPPPAEVALEVRGRKPRRPRR